MNLPVGTAPTTTGTTRGTLAGCIFDVDGVLLASPHEQAWREALTGLAAPARDLRHGKPDPEIFVDAANMLGLGPSVCLVVEDAPAGIRAAKAGGMAGLGIARFADAALLVAAGADLVVESLDEVDRDALAQGRLGRRPE